MELAWENEEPLALARLFRHFRPVSRVNAWVWWFGGAVFGANSAPSYLPLRSQYGGSPKVFFTKSINSLTFAGKNRRSGYTA